MNKRKSLGRGLDALLSSATVAARRSAASSRRPRSTAAGGSAGAGRATRSAGRPAPARQIPAARRHARGNAWRSSRSRSKRRASFSRSSCGRCAIPGGGETRYEIVAGERRWRAAQLAGLHAIPAVVRDIPDEAAVAVALIENIQRENLNPIEEARSLHRLVEEFGLTHADAAEAVGRSRATVIEPAAAARVAATGPRDARAARARHGPRARAARAPVARACRSRSRERIVKQGWSVRETESRGAPRRGPARELEAGEDGARGGDPNVRRLESGPRRDARRRGAIEHGPKGGRVVIRYHGLEELEGILAHIK